MFFVSNFFCDHLHYSDKNMKGADHFFFYAIIPWPDSSDIIRYPTSPYCKYTLVNSSML